MKINIHSLVLTAIIIILDAVSAFPQAGTLDSTFGTNGVVTMGIGTVTSEINILAIEPLGVAIQSNGKIVVAASEVVGSKDDFAVIRFKTDGTLDSTFGSGGIATTSITSGNDKALAVALQPDGKIVAAGVAADQSNSSFTLARYDTDGTLDGTFGTNGIVTGIFHGAITTTLSQGTNRNSRTFSGSFANSVIIQADGKILAGGTGEDGGHGFFVLARCNADGSLDTTFADSGRTVIYEVSGAFGYSVREDTNGKIIFGGAAWNIQSNGTDNMNYNFAAQKFNSNGVRDNTFGTGGLTWTPIHSDESVEGNYADDYAYSVIIQPDGKLIFAGTSQLGPLTTDGGSDWEFAMLRYNTNGTLDNTFGTNGTVETSVTGEDLGYCAARQANGKIVMGGMAGNNICLVRYDSTGIVDSTFGSNGAVITGVGITASPYSVAIGSDGKIVVAGYAGLGNWNHIFVIRYNGDAADHSLPVQASGFLATANSGSVHLSWNTKSEVDNAGFNVLREDPNTSSFSLITSYTINDSLRGLGTSSIGRSYGFTDAKVISGGTYVYKIQSISTNGTTKDLSTLSVRVDVPKTYALYQNYPNPFNPSTTIRFDLKEQSTVKLDVYNVLGQQVLSEDYRSMGAGRFNEVVNMAGFASGVYFYRLTAAGNDGEKFATVKRFMLLK